MQDYCNRSWVQGKVLCTSREAEVLFLGSVLILQWDVLMVSHPLLHLLSILRIFRQVERWIQNVWSLILFTQIHLLQTERMLGWRNVSVHCGVLVLLKYPHRRWDECWLSRITCSLRKEFAVPFCRSSSYIEATYCSKYVCVYIESLCKHTQNHISTSIYYPFYHWFKQP